MFPAGDATFVGNPVLILSIQYSYKNNTVCQKLFISINHGYGIFFSKR